MNKELTKPIPHLNGSGKKNLLEQYTMAAEAVFKVMEVVNIAACPHGRDYYVSKDECAFSKARTEHRARMEKLREVFDELQELVLHVSDWER